MKHEQSDIEKDNKTVNFLKMDRDGIREVG